MKAKYLPLVDRVTDRAELSDILSQMVGELSALHIFVRGGDARRGVDQVQPASLGAIFARDEKAGGFRVTHIYKTDPDVPADLAPLARTGVNVQEGDVIQMVNGVAALSARDLDALLRNQADKQLLLRVAPKAGGAARDVVVTPVTLARETTMNRPGQVSRYQRRNGTEQAVPAILPLRRNRGARIGTRRLKLAIAITIGFLAVRRQEVGPSRSHVRNSGDACRHASPEFRTCLP